MANNFGTIRNRFKLLLVQKEYREGRNIPYLEIQEATGIAASTLSIWAGQKVTRFSADTLAALCVYLDCTPGDLLEYVPSSALNKNT